MGKINPKNPFLRFLLSSVQLHKCITRQKFTIWDWFSVGWRFTIWLLLFILSLLILCGFWKAGSVLAIPIWILTVAVTLFCVSNWAGALLKRWGNLG